MATLKSGGFVQKAAQADLGSKACRAPPVRICEVVQYHTFPCFREANDDFTKKPSRPATQRSQNHQLTRKLRCSQQR